MAQVQYQLHLKGFVGGWDFDADYVDYVLEKYAGKEVNVLIDSLGGRSDTALSIYAAFKRHGNVNVHFVGMNASAATIASLGAKRITMDASAMYLVHRCSIDFFEWARLNAEDLQRLIESIERDMNNLNKLDANVAELYARKCKKTPDELMALMKEGGWLSSSEAKEWGFVDEITEYDSDEAPVLDNMTAQALADAGIPLPKSMRQSSAWNKFINALTDFFSGGKAQIQQGESSSSFNIMKKVYTNICAILTVADLEVKEENVTMTDAQMDSIESAIVEDRNTIQSLKEKITALESEKANMQAQIDALKKKPAEESHQVVSQKQEKPSEMEAFVSAREAAADLYNMFD